MHEIVDKILMIATEFMEDSGLRMDEDLVGKPLDLFLWCSVRVSGWRQELGSLKMPVRHVVLAPSASPR